MTAVEALRAARKLIESPERWTQGGWGRTEHGPIPSCTLEKLAAATCLCADGALLLACGELPLPRGASSSLSQAAHADERWALTLLNAR